MTSTPFSKQYQSPKQLVALLKERGLQITDESEAETFMRNVGYYRLSAYLYPLLAQPKQHHFFKPGSSLSTAMSLYRFDCELRMMLFSKIAKIEIAIRSAMANIVAKESGNIFWTTDADMFVNRRRYDKTQEIIKKELDHSKEEFIKHFRKKYSDPFPPAWILVEILPIGTLNHLYNNLADNSLRKKIAQTFSLPAPVFKSWFTVVILTRNACCHHARVWNKKNSILPIVSKNLQCPWIGCAVARNKIFYDICIIKHFIDAIEPDNNFKQDFKVLLASYPDVDIRAMGVPDNWEHDPLWRK